MSMEIAEHDVTVLLGDVREQLATIAAGSVQCVVTSPPYYGLRDYGCDGQIGLEPSPAEYVETMRAVFAAARRVLADDGTLWLNLGDSYANGSPGGSQGSSGQRRGRAFTAVGSGGCTALPAKNMLGIPWRVALALQNDGWILRSAIIWHKSNAMPESVTDRLSTRYEHVFLFSKSRRYHFDLDNIRERDRETTLGRNPGDVWTIPTSPFAGAHFATMPPELARRCLMAGCPEGRTVLDPFAGSGTTLMVARQLDRKSVGIELNPAYVDIIRQRIGQTPFDFGEATA